MPTLFVKDCSDCVFRQEDEMAGIHVCRHPNVPELTVAMEREVSKGTVLPDWCPLHDESFLISITPDLKKNRHVCSRG